MRFFVFTLVLLSLFSNSVFAGQTYFQNRANGWFWYIDPVIKPKRPKVKPKTKSVVVPQTIEDLREEAKRLLERSVMDPSKENITAYLIIQKIILDKAETFARNWREVVWTTPELDYVATHPVSNRGLTLYKQEIANNQATTLHDVARKTGLFFIFSSSCQYCVAQAGILKRFADKYGFRVLPVTTDGRGLPEYPYPQSDNGISERLQVERTPSIFIAAPPDRVTLVSSGLLTFDELEERVATLGKKMLYEVD